MLKNNLLMRSVSVMFGVALAAPSAALAQVRPFSVPLLVSARVARHRLCAQTALFLVVLRAHPAISQVLHPHFSRLDRAAGPHGLDRGGRANLRGIEGRAAPLSPNSYARNRHASHRYGLANRYWLYAAAEASAYAGSYASSEEEDCYYVSAYRRDGYRRVLRCVGNWFNC